MKRREFITLLSGAAVAWPLGARGQQGERMRRIGVLMDGAATETAYQSYLAALIQGLRQLGWTEGRNLHVDVRWSAANAELGRIYAAQLIGLAPDVILTSSTAELTAIQEATSTIPVVFLSVSDPVAQGFVASVTKPGGNLTGFSSYEFSIGGKWLDLLKQAAPSLARVGVMFNPDTSLQSKFLMRSIETAAALLGVQTMVVPVRATADIEPALESFARQPNGGLILPTDSFMRSRLRLAADLTLRNRLPSISPYPDFPKDGGLMYYGAVGNLVDQYRQAAVYVDRILKGEKPGDLPVQQRDKYTLAINLKTAKALGLTVPLTLVTGADDVIE